jgi:hypothetical protein
MDIEYSIFMNDEIIVESITPKNIPKENLVGEYLKQ